MSPSGSRGCPSRVTERSRAGFSSTKVSPAARAVKWMAARDSKVSSPVVRSRATVYRWTSMSWARVCASSRVSTDMEPCCPMGRGPRSRWGCAVSAPGRVAGARSGVWGGGARFRRGRLLRCGRLRGAPRAVRERLVVADHLGDDEIQQFLGERGVEPGALGELAEPGDLAGFAGRVGGRQVVCGFEEADLLGAFEPFGQHMDDCRVDVVDAAAEPVQFGLDGPVDAAVVTRGHGAKA